MLPLLPRCLSKDTLLITLGPTIPTPNPPAPTPSPSFFTPPTSDSPSELTKLTLEPFPTAVPPVGVSRRWRTELGRRVSSELCGVDDMYISPNPAFTPEPVVELELEREELGLELELPAKFEDDADEDVDLGIGMGVDLGFNPPLGRPIAPVFCVVAVATQNGTACAAAEPDGRA